MSHSATYAAYTDPRTLGANERNHKRNRVKGMVFSGSRTVFVFLMVGHRNGEHLRHAPRRAYAMSISPS